METCWRTPIHGPSLRQPATVCDVRGGTRGIIRLLSEFFFKNNLYCIFSCVRFLLKTCNFLNGQKAFNVIDPFGDGLVQLTLMLTENGEHLKFLCEPALDLM
jgi:hypothetical protein